MRHSTFSENGANEIVSTEKLHGCLLYSGHFLLKPDESWANSHRKIPIYWKLL